MTVRSFSHTPAYSKAQPHKETILLSRKPGEVANKSTLSGPSQG